MLHTFDQFGCSALNILQTLNVFFSNKSTKQTNIRTPDTRCLIEVLRYLVTTGNRLPHAVIDFRINRCITTAWLNYLLWFTFMLLEVFLFSRFPVLPCKYGGSSWTGWEWSRKRQKREKRSIALNENIRRSRIRTSSIRWEICPHYWWWYGHGRLGHGCCIF